MSGRKKASILVFNKRGGFDNHKIKFVVGTGTGTIAKQGVIWADVVTDGVATGDVFITIDTAGTGTQIDA